MESDESEEITPPPYAHIRRHRLTPPPPYSQSQFVFVQSLTPQPIFIVPERNNHWISEIEEASNDKWFNIIFFLLLIVTIIINLFKYATN
jgi:hypothetical protein